MKGELAAESGDTLSRLAAPESVSLLCLDSSQQSMLDCSTTALLTSLVSRPAAAAAMVTGSMMHDSSSLSTCTAGESGENRLRLETRSSDSEDSEAAATAISAEGAGAVGAVGSSVRLLSSMDSSC